IVDPAQPYSAARFRQDALRLIEEIQSRAHVPLLVGGTMLYFRALAGGLSELPPASAEFRAKLSAEAEAAGWPALHQRLQALDPVTAQRLHPNDSQRIQRALEVAMLSGQALSQLQNAQRRPQLPMLRIALQLDDRKRLHQRIEDRLRKMLEAGFHQEVARLHARGDLHPALPSIRAVGYRQIWAYLEGETSREHAEQRALAATRQFAKRQLTWLRSETGLQTLDALAPDLLDQAWNLVSNQAS
ncbi:MAG: tRNA (adenosine(37)-N6)-dimethylallyltransferase MiaA, partial [Panacagrimonas sp.]